MGSTSSDSLQIILTGLANGTSGRQTQVVNEHFALDKFLEDYGDGVKADIDFDLAALTKEAVSDPDSVQTKLAELAKQLTGQGAKSKAQRVVDAVCNFLEKEKGFVISDQDPGDNVYYVSRGNLQPTTMSIPNDGTAWTVIAVAPYGNS